MYTGSKHLGTRVVLDLAKNCADKKECEVTKVLAKFTADRFVKFQQYMLTKMVELKQNQPNIEEILVLVPHGKEIWNITWPRTI